MESSSHDVTGLWWKSFLVALVSFAFLAQGVERTGIASALTNPIDHIHAQDESIYANASLRMAAHGNWLTPIVMGRIFLYKPPLLEMLAGLSLKIFGISLFALRLPSLLAASFAVALLFAWSTHARGIWAGAIAALLLLSNSAWVTFARLCYTDILLASFTAAGMFCLAVNPRLNDAKTRWGFIVFSAAAILTKSAAGVVPLLALGFFLFLGRPEARLSLGDALRVTMWIALCVAPWHVYQLVVHRQWFWTDYIQVQLLQFGFRPALPGSAEVPLWFYLKRLLLTDPFLCTAAGLALLSFARAIRSSKEDARVLGCWLGVVLVAISIFQYRNFPYALMAIAPLSVLAACYLPAKFQRWIAAALVLVLAAKLIARNEPWSLTYSTSEPLRAAALVRAYMDRGRANELILLDTDDEFYSSTLPLAKVRYCFRDPANITVRYAPYYVDLGITVMSDTFTNIEVWEPLFRERLRAWGLDSSEPIATSIVARSDADVAALILSHPHSDFYVPVTLLAAVSESAERAHTVLRVSDQRAFLLSTDLQGAGRVPKWPRRW